MPDLGLERQPVRDTPDLPVLMARARAARQWLRQCTMCELRCGVDRCAASRGGRRGPCGLTAQTWCYKRHLSLAEEPELLPAYMVYLSACNFRCRYCIQGPDCFAPERGTPVEPAAMVEELVQALDRGAKTIVLIGGEPSLHVHTIVEIAAAAAEQGAPRLPLVLKTNLFMTPRVLDLLDGVIDRYVVDFKFGSDQCALHIAHIDGYLAVVQRNLRALAGRTPLVVRHLLTPGHVECCFEPVARWVAAHLPPGVFRLMTGYVPAWRAEQGNGELARGLRTDEINRAEAVLHELGLAREVA